MCYIAAGRPAWLSHRTHRLQMRASADKDSDKDNSERGRLVSDILQFDQSQPKQASKQQPASAAPASQHRYKQGDLLGNKYTVIEVLGLGKAGVTYKVHSCNKSFVLFAGCLSNALLLNT